MSIYYSVALKSIPLYHLVLCLFDDNNGNTICVTMVTFNSNHTSTTREQHYIFFNTNVTDGFNLVCRCTNKKKINKERRHKVMHKYNSLCPDIELTERRLFWIGFLDIGNKPSNVKEWRCPHYSLFTSISDCLIKFASLRKLTIIMCK